MIEVTTCVDRAGQFFTVGAQLVMVISVVLKMVDVVSRAPVSVGAVSRLETLPFCRAATLLLLIDAAVGMFERAEPANVGEAT